MSTTLTVSPNLATQAALTADALKPAKVSKKE